jgi:hypothetical protein
MIFKGFGIVFGRDARDCFVEKEGLGLSLNDRHIFEIISHIDEANRHGIAFNNAIGFFLGLSLSDKGSINRADRLLEQQANKGVISYCEHILCCGEQVFLIQVRLLLAPGCYQTTTTTSTIPTEVFRQRPVSWSVLLGQAKKSESFSMVPICRRSMSIGEEPSAVAD